MSSAFSLRARTRGRTTPLVVAFMFLCLAGACKEKQTPTSPRSPSPSAPATQRNAAPSGIPAPADGRRATESAIDSPTGIAIDASGDAYITSPVENRVYKIGSDGILRLIAGNGLPGFSGDEGPATTARLDQPFGIAVDSKGNIYVADQLNRRIRKITPSGIISTVAGNGTEGYSGDGGAATAAQMSIPHGVAVDTQDNLYFSEHSRIRKVTSDGVITTASMTLGSEGLAVDSDGNLYTVGTNRIYKMTPQSVVSTLAGNGTGGATFPGSAVGGPLGGPTAVAVDRGGSVYICTGYGHVWKVSNGRIIAFAGGRRANGLGDGEPATSGRLQSPWGLAVDSNGNVYIADSGNHRVRKVNTSGRIETVAGTGLSGYRGDGGPAKLAQLVAGSLKITIDRAGNLYIADQCRIRKVNPPGTITTVAGTGVCGYAGDGGPATAAQLNFSSSAAPDTLGNLYIADTENSRIRRVSVDGIISTFAGNGVAGEAGDGGPATAAQLRWPRDVAADGKGNVYIVDGSVRIVDSNGAIRTLIAGAGGYGGPVTEALKGPEGIALDAMGNVYVADTNNYRIRKLTPDGLLSTIAGTGTLGFWGDGAQAVTAQLLEPRGVAVDAEGNVYIADSGNLRVRKVTPAGIITTVAGNGSRGFGGNGGPAIGAQLTASSVALDQAGNLYISDQGNRRIRKVSPDGVIMTIVGVGPPAVP